MPWSAKSHEGKQNFRSRWVRYGAVLLSVGVLLAVWLLLADGVRSRLEAWVEESVRGQLPSGCEVERTEVSFFPPTLVIIGLHCPPPLTELKTVRVEPSVTASLRLLSLCVSLHLSEVLLDFSGGDSDEDSAKVAEGTEPGLRFVLPLAARMFGRDIRLRVPYGNGVAELSVFEAAATVRSSQLGTSLELKAAKVAWRRERTVLEAESLAARARESSAGWQLAEGEVSGPDLQARAWHAERGGTDFWLESPAENLAAFVDGVTGLTGSLEARGRLAGDLFDPMVQAELVVQSPGYQDLRGRQLEASLIRVGEVLELSGVRAEFDDGEVTADVAFRFATEASLQAAVSWQCWGDLGQCGLPWAESTLWKDWVARASAEFTAVGTVVPHHLFWSVSGVVEIDEGRVANRESRPIQWHVAGRSEDEKVLWAGRGEALELGQVEGHGVWAGEEVALSAKVHVAEVENWVRRIPEIRAAEFPEVQGGVELRIEAAGRPPIVHWRAALEGSALRVEGVQLGLLFCSVEGLVDRWHLHKCRAGSTDMGWVEIRRLTAKKWKEVDELQVEADSLSLQPFVRWVTRRVGAIGWIDGGRISGAFTWPTRDEQRLRIEGLSVGGESLREVTALITPQAGGTWAVTVQAEHVRAGQVEVHWFGTMGATGNLELVTRALDLAALEGLNRVGLQGTFSMSGKLRIEWPSVHGGVFLDLKGLMWRGWDWGDAGATVQFIAQSWRLSATALSADLQIDASGELGGKFPFHVEMAFGRSKPVTSRRGAVYVAAQGSGQLGGTLLPFQVDRGRAEVGLLEIRATTRVIRNARPIRIHMVRGVISPSVVEFELPRGRATVTIGGPTDRGFEIGVNVDSELAWVRDVFQLPGVIGGSVSAATRLYYDGPMGWNVTGQLECTGCSFERQGVPALTDVSAVLRLENSESLAVKITGAVGGGRLVVEGLGDLIRGPLLRWKVEDAVMEGWNGWEANVDAHGTIEGTWAAPLVTGDVIIQRAEYARDVQLLDLLRGLQEKIVGSGAMPARSTPAIPLALDLKVYSSGGVFIENNVAEVELWVDIWLNGPANDPNVGGRVGVLGGEVKFQSRTFTLDYGKIEFRDSLSKDPVLELSGDTEIRTPTADYLVLARVEGTASAPRIQLTADDPTLTQADLVALVLFGRTRAGIQTATSTSSPVGTALGVLATDAVQRPVAQWLGIDRFEVGAAQSSAASTLEPKVTIGKALTDQLHAVLWTTVGSLTRQAVQLEYRVGRRVSLLGSWESGTTEAGGAVGGDVKFRFETYRVPFSICP